jgi:tetratricopeptide (TPR) repeat protein
LAKDNRGDYEEALSYYEKALEIRQKNLPPKHPDLAASYNNIGLVYGKMGDYSRRHFRFMGMLWILDNIHYLQITFVFNRILRTLN